MTEKQVIISLKEGDHKAFTFLYHQYWKQVYNFCRLYVREDAAEEVMQEVFVKLWTVRESINEEESLKGYLFIITRNLIFNQSRKSAYESSFKMLLMSVVEELCEFEDELCADDLSVYIDKLIAEMPPQRQLIFNLSRKEYLTHREIAMKLNITEKTVEQSIGRTLKSLKEKMIPLLTLLFMLLLSSSGK